MYYLITFSTFDGMMTNIKVLERSNCKERLEYLKYCKYQDLKTKILKEEEE